MTVVHDYFQDRLSTLPGKAVMIVYCNFHRHKNIMDLERYFNLQPPRRRRAEHHSAIMYRLSRNGHILDTYRPKINLRSRRKVKFKQRRRNMKKILKSPLSGRIKLWNRIPLAIQWSVTKVKFKNNLRLFPDL